MPLLSICIPTYNRSFYIRKCLDAIFSQTDGNSSIEIIICDNASTDDTGLVVQQFSGRHLPLRYSRNETNEGPDRNVKKCFVEATGQYVLVMGDDDLLLPGSLERILSILAFQKYGVIFLNYYGFKHDHIKEHPKVNLFTGNYVFESDSILSKIRGNLGFISAFVLERKLIKPELLQTYSGTNLNHVPVILTAIKTGKVNVFVGEYLLAQKVGNSGGFKYFEVICKNYHKILTEFLGNSRSMNWITNEFISNVFPWAILQARKKTNPECFEENGYYIIESIYKHSPGFWIFVYPMGKLPLALVGVYFYFIKIVAKILYFLRRTQFGRTL